MNAPLVPPCIPLDGIACHKRIFIIILLSAIVNITILSFAIAQLA